MSPGSQSSAVTVIPKSTSTNYFTVETRKRGAGGRSRQLVPRKSIDTFGQRTSQYHGVTRFIYIICTLSLNFFQFNIQCDIAIRI